MSDTKLCNRCGAFGDMPHGWIEGDCILPHKTHAKEKHGHVCQPCVDRHDEWLTEIVDLYATLAEVVLAGSIMDDDTGEYQKPRKAPASPSPLRLAAWAMLFDTARLLPFVRDRDGTVTPAHLGANLPDVPAVLAGWAQAASDALCWTSTAPDTVSGAAAVLRAHRETVAAQPWVDEYDTELRWVRRHLRAAHGINNPAPYGACLNVDCGGNVWPQPASMPKCDRCNRRYGTLDLVRLKVMEEAS